MLFERDKKIEPVSSLRKVIFKNLYYTFLVLYFLWLVSCYMIVVSEGFHSEQDLPWFVLLISVLVFFWWFKSTVTGDWSLFFGPDTNLLVSYFYLSRLLSGAALMVVVS